MKNIFLTIIAMTILFNVTTYTPNELYGNTGEVIQIYNECIKIKDRTGNIWIWTDVEDWLVGDKLVMTIFDNGTQTIKDDKIIKLTYIGY